MVYTTGTSTQKGKKMKKTILTLAVIATVAQADIAECKFRLHMGDDTNKVALRLYKKGDYIGAMQKFKMARSNYIIGFRHCRNTKYEDSLIDHSEITSEMINDSGFKKQVAIQKLMTRGK